jgi:hypothetical protein
MRTLFFATALVLYALSSVGFADVESMLNWKFRSDTVTIEIECSQKFLNQEFNKVADEVRCYQRDSPLSYTKNLVNLAIDEGMFDQRSLLGYKISPFERTDGVLTKRVDITNDADSYSDTSLAIQLHEVSGERIIVAIYTDYKFRCPTPDEYLNDKYCR